MKRIVMFLVLALSLGGLAQANVPCCDVSSGCCPAPVVCTQPVRVSAVVGDLVHCGVSYTAAGLKHGARIVSELPADARQQIAASTPRIQSHVRNAAAKTESVVQKISAEVTTLSLELLRSALSSFWALISGLLLS